MPIAAQSPRFSQNSAATTLPRQPKKRLDVAAKPSTVLREFAREAAECAFFPPGESGNGPDSRIL